MRAIGILFRRKNFMDQKYKMLEAKLVKNPPAMCEIWVRSLGWEDRLEVGMATHSNILAWRIPMDKGAWQATDHGVTKSQKQLTTHAWSVSISLFITTKKSRAPGSHSALPASSYRAKIQVF